VQKNQYEGIFYVTQKFFAMKKFTSQAVNEYTEKDDKIGKNWLDNRRFCKYTK